MSAPGHLFITALLTTPSIWLIPSTPRAKDHWVAKVEEIRENPDTSEVRPASPLSHACSSRQGSGIRCHTFPRAVVLHPAPTPTMDDQAKAHAQALHGLSQAYIPVRHILSRVSVPLSESYVHSSSRLGQHELVLTNHSDILELGNVLRTGVVEQFLQESPCDRPTPSDRPFYRFSMEMDRFLMDPGDFSSPVKRFDWGQETGPFAFLVDGPKFGCGLGCGRLYTPDRDIQRFCRRCENWYDVTCLDLHEMQLDEDTKRDRMSRAVNDVPSSMEYPSTLHPVIRGTELMPGTETAFDDLTVYSCPKCIDSFV